jgi:hypothetical protein
LYVALEDSEVFEPVFLSSLSAKELKATIAGVFGILVKRCLGQYTA